MTSLLKATSSFDRSKREELASLLVTALPVRSPWPTTSSYPGTRLVRDSKGVQ